MNFCDHPNMKQTARIDLCPDCGYQYYYGDAHSVDPELRQPKLVEQGRHNPGPATDYNQQCQEMLWQQSQKWEMERLGFQKWEIERLDLPFES